MKTNADKNQRYNWALNIKNIFWCSNWSICCLLMVVVSLKPGGSNYHMHCPSYLCQCSSLFLCVGFRAEPWSFLYTSQFLNYIITVYEPTLLATWIVPFILLATYQGGLRLCYMLTKPKWGCWVICYCLFVLETQFFWQKRNSVLARALLFYVLLSCNGKLFSHNWASIFSSS